MQLPEKFKNIQCFQKHLQALALADAIFSSEWEYRYFSFNSQWDPKNKEKMASFRDGQGNEYFILFSQNQVIAKVFSPSLLSHIDLNLIPKTFQNFKNEVAFSLENSSYIFWFDHANNQYTFIPEQLDHYPLLEYIHQSIEDYWHWAQDYYEIDIDLSMLQQLFETLEITESLLKILNPELDLENFKNDQLEILG